MICRSLVLALRVPILYQAVLLQVQH